MAVGIRKECPRMIHIMEITRTPFKQSVGLYGASSTSFVIVPSEPINENALMTSGVCLGRAALATGLSSKLCAPEAAAELRGGEFGVVSRVAAEPHLVELDGVASHDRHKVENITRNTSDPVMPTATPKPAPGFVRSVCGQAPVMLLMVANRSVGISIWMDGEPSKSAASTEPQVSGTHRPSSAGVGVPPKSPALKEANT
mmetsp:Transcript_78068/g.203342  ORF Transcript_78068/g.203342 Transcript_78068/m.203342 type:complete len:200 (+) Transcript_78068:70-669(+)